MRLGSLRSVLHKGLIFYRGQSGTLIDGVVALLSVVITLIVRDAAIAAVTVAISPGN